MITSLTTVVVKDDYAYPSADEGFASALNDLCKEVRAQPGCEGVWIGKVIDQDSEKRKKVITMSSTHILSRLQKTD